MHCHSYYSKDSICSPSSLLENAWKKGLDGIALTDHDTTKGWEEAEKTAKELKMFLIKGQEIKIRENGRTIGEILAYFLEEAIDTKGKGLTEITREIREQGGISIIAHPFNAKKPFKDIERHKDSVDGIESFNSRSQDEEGNDNSLLLARKYGLPFTGGSDAHTPFEVGNCYIESSADSLEGLKKAILDKKIRVVGKRSPYLLQVFSPIAKTIHRFWKP